MMTSLWNPTIISVTPYNCIANRSPIYLGNVDSSFYINVEENHFPRLYVISHNNHERLIIGAPKGNYSSTSTSVIEHGVAYRCSLDNGECVEIMPRILKDEERHMAQLNLNMFIRKQYGWFGSAIAIDEINGILTVSKISSSFTGQDFRMKISISGVRTADDRGTFIGHQFGNHAGDVLQRSSYFVRVVHRG